MHRIEVFGVRLGMICLESERNIAKTLYIPKIPYVINYH